MSCIEVSDMVTNVKLPLIKIENGSFSCSQKSYIEEKQADIV